MENNTSIEKLLSQDQFMRFMRLSDELNEQVDIAGQIRVISSGCRDILGAERGSVFIEDTRFGTHNLYTIHADSIDHIFVPSGKGIVGRCIREKKSSLVNNVKSDPDFYDLVDDEDNSFITKNLIATPFFSFDHKRAIGALEVLNKTEGDFTKSDVIIMEFLANFCNGMIETMMNK